MAAIITPGGCVDGIEALLATVPDIGRVHRRRRSLLTEAQVRDVLYHPGQRRIHGWMISPATNDTAVSVRHPGYYGIGSKGGGNVLTMFQFQLEGWFGIDDAAGSEETFRDLAWAVADEFNAYGMIPGITGINDQTAANVETFTYALVAGLMFLHYARIGIGFGGRTRPNP